MNNKLCIKIFIIASLFTLIGLTGCGSEKGILHEHSYSSEVTNIPTCTNEGIKTYICSCGESYKETMDMAAHSIDSNNVCSYCEEECVIYNYENTEFVGPVNTDKDFVTVNVKTSDGSKIVYKIHNQKSYKFTSRNEFLNQHGCAVSSLTMVLNMKVPELAYYEPNDTIDIIEKSVLGDNIYDDNYGKESVAAQMPITLYGMTKILSAYGVDHKYVYNYNKSEAKNDIVNNLSQGKPVVVFVKDDGKWTKAYHVMTLIGFDDNGNIIIADTCDREWSGTNQRIKYSTLDEMVDHMVTETKPPAEVYWGKDGGKFGYILVY